MAVSIVDISLPLLGRCLRVDNADEVVSALSQAMPGWQTKIETAQGALPARYIYRDAEGLWQGSLDEEHEFRLPSAASAACSLVGELVSLRMKNQPELLGLHCASVEINNRLVLFPESSKAGKSTLAVAFAAAGYKVFGDDVLGLTEQGEGVAMGVAPRLRLPLPDSFSTEFVDYAKRHAGPEDERYRFVLPGGEGLAHFNDTSPVGAIVLLERDVSIVEPEVVTLPAAEGLLQLLCQNFAHDTANHILLERLLPLMQAVPCLLLRYSEPLQAARYLAKIIQDPQLPVNKASLLTLPSSELPACSNTASTILERRWTPQTDITSYPLGNELFLIHTLNGAIHRLNSSGNLVWQLLQQQTLSGYELSELVASYFQAPLATVTIDVSTLLTTLAQAELVSELTSE